MVAALLHQNECLKIIKVVVGATLVVALLHQMVILFHKMVAQKNKGGDWVVEGDHEGRPYR
jgi:hypothetical protein